MSGDAQMRIIVTGGAGFIGSHLVLSLVREGHHVLNIDKLTYAANIDYLAPVLDNSLYSFAKLDICDKSAISDAIEAYQPDMLMHLAAESHVDRSIDNADSFIQTNLVGTASLLSSALSYYSAKKTGDFKFIHVSTDEVYGDLQAEDPKFCEESNYKPNSPYSASKAGSDHLARAWYRTYDLPVIITHCSNNYGPHQHDEKLIPTVIAKAVSGQSIPVYGNGQNVRDWIHVHDHVAGLMCVVTSGKKGETYNFGGDNEIRNIDLVHKICAILDEKRPLQGGKSYAGQISFVTDRKGHDIRYAVNNDKSQRDLRWKPQNALDTGLRETIDWYLKKIIGN